MRDILHRKKMKIGDVRKAASCCAPEHGAQASPCCPRPASSARAASSMWSLGDHIGQVRCRTGSFRMRYRVEPGLYSLGSPAEGSDVFVSANYKLSFDILRRSLAGLNAWILVLDTGGINVWCAAGKGTFGTDEIVRRVTDAGLGDIVSHRRLIVPQLGAPGVAAHKVKAATGFTVVYGPVRAGDIRAFVGNGYKAAEETRSVRFGIFDRLVLTPMELNPALKKYVLYALAVLLVFGVAPGGFLNADGAELVYRFLLLGLSAVISGSFLTPLLLPFIPGRSFAVKGWITGMAASIAFIRFAGFKGTDSTPLLLFALLFFPAASSYLALQFTGSTCYTGPSGVKKELRYAVPVYAAAAALSAASLVVFKLSQWGVLL